MPLGVSIMTDCRPVLWASCKVILLIHSTRLQLAAKIDLLREFNTVPFDQEDLFFEKWQFLSCLSVHIIILDFQTFQCRQKYPALKLLPGTGTPKRSQAFYGITQSEAKLCVSTTEPHEHTHTHYTPSHPLLSFTINSCAIVLSLEIKAH